MIKKWNKINKTICENTYVVEEYIKNIILCTICCGIVAFVICLIILIVISIYCLSMRLC